MNNQTKKFLVHQNIYACRFSIFKNLPVLKSQKNFYNENFNITPPYEYANVQVNKVSHPLDVAYEYIKMGCKPVIINTVTENFSGTNIDVCEGFIDPMINIRTSFNNTLNVSTLLPLKYGEAMYAPVAYIIRRGDNMQMLTSQQVIKISIITLVAAEEINTSKKKFKFDDYVKILQQMETAFQTAILGGNDTIIFNDFGCKSNNYPLDDIINMFNGCIYKYGHMIRNIIIAPFVTKQAEMGYASGFEDKIVRPQHFIQEYMQKEKIVMDELQHNLSNINEQVDLQYSNMSNNQPEQFNPFAQLGQSGQSGQLGQLGQLNDVNYNNTNTQFNPFNQNTFQNTFNSGVNVNQLKDESDDEFKKMKKLQKKLRSNAEN